MKQITVISGKGGTGKTTLTAALAYLARPVVLSDCDVDAANLHLLASAEPGTQSVERFTSGTIAHVDSAACTGCGMCVELCRFGAISMAAEAGATSIARIDAVKCEGCGVCVDHCPVSAFREEPRHAGELVECTTQCGPMAYGSLLAGQPNSGKLVAQVRIRAQALVEQHGLGLVVVDGPPGIGCPAIASLGGVNLALVVVEPTASAQHDMQRVFELCEHFNVTPVVLVNKADLNSAIAERIEQACSQQGIECIGRVSYDEAVAKALVDGRTVVEASPTSTASREIAAAWDKLRTLLG